MTFKEMLNNKIVKAGSWYTFMNFFLKGMAFLTIPIFTRLLNTEDYGNVALYNTWVGIFTIVIGLSLGESIRRGKFDYEDNYDSFVSSITFLSFLIFLVFISIVLLFRDVFIRIIGISGVLFYLIFIHAFFNYINEFAITKFQFEYKYKKITLINILKSIIAILLSIIFILYIFSDSRYLGRIVGIIIPLFIVSFYFFIHLIKSGKELVNLKYWKYALVLCLPLVFHRLSHIINMQFDRILIDRFIGKSATGLYSFAYNIGIIVQVIFVSLEQAWSPWFFEKMKDKDYNTIRKRAYKLMEVFTIAYVLVLMLSPELIKVMAKKEYWEGLIIIPWIAMSYYFNFMYIFEVNVEFANKRTGLISLGTVFTAGINILLNILFIPKYGYIAAAITTVISYFLLFLFHYFITTKVIKQNVFGIKFHLRSVLFVSSITVYYIVFREIFFMRIVGIGIAFLLFYKSIKDMKN